MDVVDRLEEASQPVHETQFGTAVVTNAAAGTFPDGRHKITVSWLTTSIDCAYLASYTPTVNDNVVFLKSGSSFFVLGKPA